jgi:LacI family transcriptional regulator
MAARALARGRSNNIALVLGQPHQQIFIDEYIPKILTGLRQVMQQHGFRILVELIEDDTPPDIYTNLLRGKEVAGIIASFRYPRQEDLTHLAAFTGEHFPIVMLDDPLPGLYSVSVDKLEGVRKVVGHLIGLGHQRIACISYAPKGHPRADKRLATYREVLEKAGLTFESSLVRYGAFDPETGYAAAKSLLESGHDFTAIYAMNDVMAFGALQALREQNLRVPEDIAVVGFDDIRLASYANPPLTTVYEPDIEHGRRAGEMLVQLINGKTPSEPHVILDTQLIIRQSCGAYLL